MFKPGQQTLKKHTFNASISSVVRCTSFQEGLHNGRELPARFYAPTTQSLLYEVDKVFVKNTHLFFCSLAVLIISQVSTLIFSQMAQRFVTTWKKK